MSNRRERRWLYQAQNGKCHYCRRAMTMKVDLPHTCTRDHVKPRSDGGDDTPDNLVGACLRCNTVKGSLSHGEFMALVRAGQLPEIEPGEIDAKGQKKREERKELRRERKERLQKLARNALEKERRKEKAGYDRERMGLEGAFSSSFAEILGGERRVMLARMADSAPAGSEWAAQRIERRIMAAEWRLSMTCKDFWTYLREGP